MEFLLIFQFDMVIIKLNNIERKVIDNNIIKRYK
jgi:hypothetical protein